MTAACTSDSARIRKIDKAVIRWPSGDVQTLDNLLPDRLYTVKEPQ